MVDYKWVILALGLAALGAAKEGERILSILSVIKNTVPWLTVGWALVLVFVCRCLYDWLLAPYHRYQLMGSEASAVNRNRREIGRIPPAYPNGWFHLLYSWEIKADAYCPHLGANLGLGGKVNGDCIQCPFHGWEFNGETGLCVRVPYTQQQIPASAKIKTYPVIEVNRMILFWYHIDSLKPEWYPPIFKEIQDGTYVFHGMTEHHVRAHIQELPENGADIEHLHFLHKPFTIDKLSSILGHLWSATWTPGKGNEKHLAHLKLTQWFTVFGKKIGFTSVQANITQTGPGLVPLSFSTPFGKAIVIECVTPVAPLHQRARHVLFSEKRMPRFIAKFILHGLILQYERDMPIWYNKTFRHNPLLVKEDATIKAFRHWYAQFYTDKQKKENETENHCATHSSLLW